MKPTKKEGEVKLHRGGDNKYGAKVFGFSTSREKRKFFLLQNWLSFPRENEREKERDREN